MAVRRRTIWLSDEEWAVLQAEAREQHTNASGVIRNMWVTSAAHAPADDVEYQERVQRVTAAATVKLGHNPYTEFRPVPKTATKKK